MKLKFIRTNGKKFKQSNLEELTSNMKPPHCHTWKCQKLNQLLNLWMAPSIAAQDEYHQD
jgi:hypothetical protein